MDQCIDIWVSLPLYYDIKHHWIHSYKPTKSRSNLAWWTEQMILNTNRVKFLKSLCSVKYHTPLWNLGIHVHYITLRQSRNNIPQAVTNIPLPWHCRHVLTLIFHIISVIFVTSNIIHHLKIFSSASVITFPTEKQRMPVPWSAIAQNATPESFMCPTRIPWYH